RPPAATPPPSPPPRARTCTRARPRPRRGPARSRPWWSPTAVWRRTRARPWAPCRRRPAGRPLRPSPPGPPPPPSAVHELLHLAHEGLLRDVRRGRVALHQRLRHVLGLVDPDVRRQRRDLRVGDRLVDHRTVGRQRLVPGVGHPVG